jgi:hypothetical protein
MIGLVVLRWSGVVLAVNTLSACDAHLLASWRRACRVHIGCA